MRKPQKNTGGVNMGLFWGYNRSKKDDDKDDDNKTTHHTMFNRRTNEHWSADIKENDPVSGWSSVSEMHRTDDTKEKGDNDRHTWRDPGRSNDMYGDDNDDQ